jgi:hypothetical protein
MFIRATGLYYQEFLAGVHIAFEFDWYLEIGTQKGNSLAVSRSRSIAIDPAFRIKKDVRSNKPELHLFEMTSDDFFNGGHLQKLGAKPNFSFLDGMHLFEYLLRDFINTEAASTKSSVIALHDCCPFRHGMTTRDLDNIPGGPWTGDVWKLIPILQEYRPDLRIEVLDCKPTGLVIVSGLNPEDQTLTQAYDQIVKNYRDLSLEDFGVERFYSSFKYISATEVVAAGFPTFRSAGVATGASIQIEPEVKPSPAPLDQIQCHDVTFYTGHRVLRDFANDLASCLTGPVGRELDIYVGVHVCESHFVPVDLRSGSKPNIFWTAPDR